MRVCKAAALSMLASIALSSSPHAAVLVEESQLVSRSPVYELIAPEARTLTVASAGRYVVTLTDVGFPAALSSAGLVVVRGIEVVLRMTGSGTQEFDATPGTYSVRVSGRGNTAGTLGVSISPKGGAPSLVYQSGIAADPVGVNSNRSTIATSFSVTQAGNYQVALSDRLFPAAAASLDLLVVTKDGNPVARACIPSAPPACSGSSVSFSAGVGDYDLFINALAASSDQAALYSVRIDGPAVVYAATHPVGKLKPLAEIQIAASGQPSLKMSDLRFPKSLSDIRFAVAQKDSILASGAGASDQSFAATQGPAAVYVVASSQSTAEAGIFSATVSQGNAVLYDGVQAVIGSTQNAAATSTKVFVYSVPIASAGQHRIQASDFAFPSSIPSLQIAAVQKGSRIGALSTAGTTTVQAETGSLVLLAIADMFSNATTGLFAVTVEAGSAAQPIFSATQGVGDLFHTRSISVTETKSIDVSAADLGFPSAFADLALTVTQGHKLVGQIFGIGKFSFVAAPGEYSLNFIARADASQNHGLFGLKLEDTPLPPEVTISAMPQTISAGGTTTVNWSAKGATSCVASGDWSGPKDTSGSAASVGPFSNKATLTLTCTGAGGSSSAVANVSIAETAKSGGGAVGFELFGALVLLLTRVRRRT